MNPLMAIPVAWTVHRIRSLMAWCLVVSGGRVA